MSKEIEVEVVYDKETDVLAIIFDKDSRNHDFIEPIPGLLIWFDENSNVRMIEILRASRFVPKLRTIGQRIKSD